MVDWLAGKRMKGTSSERTSLSTTALGGTGVGGWVELGRSTSSLPDVTSLPDKRYYMILHNGLSWSTGQNGMFRLNGDSGSNYAVRYNRNGTGETGTVSTTQVYNWIGTGNEDQIFSVGYIANYASKEKLHINHAVAQNTGGAGTAPSRDEIVNKWANTSNAINRINFTSPGAGSGSEVVVLGYDPADTHTTNFWQELASVDLSGGASTSLSTGVFTSKKYLWIQYYAERNGGGDHQQLFQVGNNTVDTGSNYSFRYSADGGADGTVINDTSMGLGWGGGHFQFGNIFVINNASNEKLFICHKMGNDVATSAYAPNRIESVGKWVNTSNQINIIKMTEEDGFTFGTTTGMKVWGAD